MMRLFAWRFGMAALSTVLFFSMAASAQRNAPTAPQRNGGYDLSREVSLQGTVVSFTENSATPPLGARVSIQTSSGVLDVHLGNAKLLQANQLTIAVGDTIRAIGENLPYGGGTQFFARIIQKGNQAVALRSPQGFPLRPTARPGKTQAGVL